MCIELKCVNKTGIPEGAKSLMSELKGIFCDEEMNCLYVVGGFSKLFYMTEAQNEEMSDGNRSAGKSPANASNSDSEDQPI